MIVRASTPGRPGPIPCSPLGCVKALCPRFVCPWFLLEPLAELQKALVLQSPIIWTDDTPVTALGGEEPGSSTGRFWVYIGDDEHPYSAYDFTTSRERDGPAEFLRVTGKNDSAMVRQTLENKRL